MADPAGPTPEDYERERAERIAANRQRMAALGLQELALDMKKSNAAFANPAKRGHVRKPRVLSSAEPRRTSNRVQGVAQEHQELVDNFDLSKGRTGVRRRRVYTGGGEYQGPLLLEYPPVKLADGTLLERARACHVCTQGEKSWRGDFPEPLWCTTCQYLYCHRCLFHISGCNDEDEAHEFIAQNQGTWMCFFCTKQCACQDPGLSRRYPRPLDRHKAWGWAGVTGGFVSLQGRPAPRACTRSTARKKQNKEARSEAAAAHEAAQETESCAAEGAAAAEDDAASPASAEEAAVTTGAAEGPRGADPQGREEGGVATPTRASERAHADAASPESPDDATPAPRAAGRAKRRAAADAAPEASQEDPEEEAERPKWSMAAPGSGIALVGKKVWAYYDLYGWCHGEVIRWHKGRNEHTVCFGRGTLKGGADDVEDVVFDGDDDTLLWGEGKPTEKPASVLAKGGKKGKKKQKK